MHKHADRHNKTTLNQQYTGAVILSTCDLTMSSAGKRAELVSQEENSEAHKTTLKTCAAESHNINRCIKVSENALLKIQGGLGNSNADQTHLPVTF